MSKENKREDINIATILDEYDVSYKSFIDLGMSEEEAKKKSTLLIKYKYSQFNL